LKTEWERLDIITAYEETGSYRAAAELCGTTHKTVGRVVAKWQAGEDLAAPRRKVERNIDAFRDLVVDKVEAIRGRISAKRLLPIERASGYEGSGRNFRRLAAEVKADWRRQHRVFRPWMHSPGEHLVIDWAEVGRWKIFCAVLGWSRVRFVRIAFDQTTDTTLRLLAECLEEIGANQVVPNAAFVRFATHYGFRPDWCEAGDPQSKELVEHLAGYAQRDLLVPQVEGWTSLEEANAAAVVWCGEVNAVVYSELAAVPAERLEIERQVLRPLPSLRPPLRRGRIRKVDRLGTVRFGSARYSVPAELVGQSVEVAAEEQRIVLPRRAAGRDPHPLVVPGEVSISMTTPAAPAAHQPEPSGPARPPSGRSCSSDRSPRTSCEQLPRQGPTSCPPSWPASWSSPRPGNVTRSPPRSSGR
jgi:transposase